ncbi:SMCO3 protein, partial [Atractosteus spatula]|nr:SMCO3 protein [Atractosteus spatula]
MSFSDLLYPDNPKRREKVVRLQEELYSLMSNNFRATNRLINTLNKHLNINFPNINIKKKGTVQENCNILINCMRRIQNEIEKIDEKLKEKLEPESYKKLHDLNLPHAEKKGLLHLISPIIGTIGTISGLVLITLIVKGVILTGMVAAIGTLATCGIAAIVLSVLFLGVDLITSAIVGAQERRRLENEISEYEKALDTFRPASQKYQDDIFYVIIRLENI